MDRHIVAIGGGGFFENGELTGAGDGEAVAPRRSMSHPRWVWWLIDRRRPGGSHGSAPGESWKAGCHERRGQ
jgi:hypothetical protein